MSFWFKCACPLTCCTSWTVTSSFLLTGILWAGCRSGNLWTAPTSAIFLEEVVPVIWTHTNIHCYLHPCLFVGLFVWLFVSRVTQKALNAWWEGQGMGLGMTHSILVQIQEFSLFQGRIFGCWCKNPTCLWCWQQWVCTVLCGLLPFSFYFSVMRVKQTWLVCSPLTAIQGLVSLLNFSNFVPISAITKQNVTGYHL